MLEQLPTLKTYTWLELEHDLKFVWQDCCPFIEIMYAGDCSERSIDRLEVSDPTITPAAHVLSEVEETIYNYLDNLNKLNNSVTI